MQKLYTYDNGITASVIDYGYGSDHGLYEIGLLDDRGAFITDTDLIPDGVIGWLTWGQVCALLRKIKALGGTQ